MDRTLLSQPEYDFLQKEPLLGENIMFLSLAGSRGYGTHHAGSDYDVRGCALPRKEDLATLQDFDNLVYRDPDTTIFSLHKMVTLLAHANPNAMEMIGFRPEEFLYLSEAGRELVEHRDMFYSRKIFLSFSEYAQMQLNRLMSALIRREEEGVEEKRALKSLKLALSTFEDRYPSTREKEISFSLNEDTGEICVNAHLSNMPIREFAGMISEINSIKNQAGKNSHRGKKKDDYHLNKHCMHLVRLPLALLDFVEEGVFYTSAEKHLDVLLPILRGEHRNEDGSIKDSFYDYLKLLDQQVKDAMEKVTLPDYPDYEKIREFEKTLVMRYVLK